MTSASKRRTMIITIALIMSLVLYGTGVFSGLYASKVIEERTTTNIQTLQNETRKDIEVIKSETRQDFDVLSNYIKFLDGYLKDKQLEESFFETIPLANQCEFKEIAMEELTEEFKYYWDRLPIRVEEYENSNEELTDEYNLLKQQYTQLSIRAWLIAKERKEKCESELIHILYFYQPDCSVCVRQGEILDELQRKLSSDGKEIIIFTIDKDIELSIVSYIVQYYSVTKAPALIIDEKLYQGRIFELEELTSII